MKLTETFSAYHAGDYWRLVETRPVIRTPKNRSENESGMTEVTTYYPTLELAALAVIRREPDAGNLTAYLDRLHDLTREIKEAVATAKP